MTDFIRELYYLISDQLPEAPYDRSLERLLRNTMSREQIKLFESYQDMEFHREEVERQALFRFLLHIP